MRRRPVVAGRRGPGRARSGAGRTSAIAAGIVLPLVAIVTAFFTTPAYDFWQDFVLGREPALRFDVRQQVPIGSPGGYLFPQGLSPQQAAALNTRDEVNLYSDLVAAGGVAVSAERGYGVGNSYRIDFVGNRRERVRITGMRVHVLERRPVPAESAAILWYPQGGAEVDMVRADLDGPQGDLVSAGSGRAFLDEQSRFAEKGEPVSFGLFASAARECLCQWELLVDVAYDDEKETIVVRSDGTPDGPPFRTASWGDRTEEESFGFAAAYERSLLIEEWVDCVEARRGVPEAVRNAKAGRVCGF